MGNLLRQQLHYPLKLHGKGCRRTTPNLSGWKGWRGWEIFLMWAKWGPKLLSVRLSRAGRHLWKPQPAQDAEVWARHKPHVSLPGLWFLPKMYLLSRARKPKAEEGMNQENCICEVWLHLQVLPPLWMQTNKGERTKQARSCLQIYFSLFLCFCKPPMPEY